MRLFLLIMVLLLFSTSAAQAHDSRPAYLGLTQSADSSFQVTWKRPQRPGVTTTIGLALPADCRDQVPVASLDLGDAVLEHRSVFCGAGGLLGKRIAFPGLDATQSDVLVRIEPVSGETITALVTSARPWIEVTTAPPGWQLAYDYTALGIKHILLGFDHLLFVLALLLLVRGGRRLFLAVTAFTLAHSITLAAATLGIVHVARPPIEAVIALSIVFLASELAKTNRGEVSLTARSPWIVAFGFGLLHGFGFAGALAEVGLPQGDIPLALLMFNVGVELGQLCFVAAVLALGLLLRKAEGFRPWRHGWALGRQVPAYAIGSLSAFWVIERASGFW